MAFYSTASGARKFVTEKTSTSSNFWSKTRKITQFRAILRVICTPRALRRASAGVHWKNFFAVGADAAKNDRAKLALDVFLATNERETLEVGFLAMD